MAQLTGTLYPANIRIIGVWPTMLTSIAALRALKNLVNALFSVTMNIL